MKKFLVVLVVMLGLAIPAVADANGNQTPFKPKDCTRSGQGLVCQQFFSEAPHAVNVLSTRDDATCPSGARLTTTSETIVERMMRIAFFSGPAPIAMWETAADESLVGIDVLSASTPVDGDCTPVS